MHLLNYVVGDITAIKPKNEKKVLILHCVNNINVMGSGVAYALSKKWPKVKNAYHIWANGNELYQETSGPFRLGEVQFVEVEDDIVVGNLVGQEGVGMGEDGVPPVRYGALDYGFENALDYCFANNINEIALPKLGAGLAGGDWMTIEKLIISNFHDEEYQIPTTIYVLDESEIPSGRD